MKLPVPFLDAAGINVGVNLGGVDVGVAEHHLEGAEIDTASEHVAGEGMAHVFRTDCLADAAASRHFADDLPEAGAGHRAALAGNKEKAAAPSAKQGRAALVQICRDPRLGVERHQPFLAAFAENADMAAAQAAILYRQIN